MNTPYQDAVARDGLRSYTGTEAKKKVTAFYDEQLGDAEPLKQTPTKSVTQKIKMLECGSCGETYVKNHWLHSLCPSCSMIAAVYLMQNAPRAKKAHFIKNIMVLAKIVTLTEREQANMTQSEFKDWAEANYVPYVMMK